MGDPIPVVFLIPQNMANGFLKGYKHRGSYILPETNVAPKEKWMVGILILSYWGGLFSWAMLVAGRVYLVLEQERKKNETVV